MGACAALALAVLLQLKPTAGLVDLEHGGTNRKHLVNFVHLFAQDRQDSEFGLENSDVNEGLIGQLFGQDQQSFPESTCQTEYTDIVGGDLNDGRLPGQRTRSPRQCQKRCQDTKGCNFFAWDRYAGYCWLKRSDGLRIPHPKIIIGPKFCQSPAPSLPSSLSSSSSSVPVVESSSPREPCAIPGPSTTEQLTPCDFA